MSLLDACSVVSTKAACIWCGYNSPTGVATCGSIPLAVVPTITILPSTSIACKEVLSVSTQLTHTLPSLSVGIGFSCFTLIS